MTAKEVKIMVDRVLGAVSLFSQGGSLRLILPKSAVRALGTRIDTRRRRRGCRQINIRFNSDQQGLDIEIVTGLSQR